MFSDIVTKKIHVDTKDILESYLMFPNICLFIILNKHLWYKEKHLQSNINTVQQVLTDIPQPMGSDLGSITNGCSRKEPSLLWEDCIDQMQERGRNQA